MENICKSCTKIFGKIIQDIFIHFSLSCINRSFNKLIITNVICTRSPNFFEFYGHKEVAPNKGLISKKI